MFKSEARAKLRNLLNFTGNPCCSQPCQNRGVCTALRGDEYECDCTGTGFYGHNCTTREYLFIINGETYIDYMVSRQTMNCTFSFLSTAQFFTWLKVTLKPAPNTVHYILTHFKGMWNIINKISFLRDGIMRYVLTCKLQTNFHEINFYGIITRYYYYF